jgi:CheY-like chemotaxis protein
VREPQSSALAGAAGAQKRHLDDTAVGADPGEHRSRPGGTRLATPISNSVPAERQDAGHHPEDVGAVLLLDRGLGWPGDFVGRVSRLGFLVVRVDDGKLLPFFVLAGGVDAILLEVTSLGMTEALALRKCREHMPRTSVVVVADESSRAGITRALEAGATAFMRFTATPAEIRRALLSGSGGRHARNIEEVT